MILAYFEIWQKISFQKCKLEWIDNHGQSEGHNGEEGTVGSAEIHGPSVLQTVVQVVSRSKILQQAPKMIHVAAQPRLTSIMEIPQFQNHNLG